MEGKPKVIGSKEDPSRGVTFFDNRSGIAFLTLDDDRGYEDGDTVFVASGTKVYGPYRLGEEIGSGNGKVHRKAFKVDEHGNRVQAAKPLTKAQLEAENARKDAALDQYRKQVESLIAKINGGGETAGEDETV